MQDDWPILMKLKHFDFLLIFYFDRSEVVDS